MISLAAMLNWCSAKQRKISLRTGLAHLEDLRPEFARSWSAESQSRFSISVWLPGIANGGVPHGKSSQTERRAISGRCTMPLISRHSFLDCGVRRNSERRLYYIIGYTAHLSNERYAVGTPGTPHRIATTRSSGHSRVSPELIDPGILLDWLFGTDRLRTAQRALPQAEIDAAPDAMVWNRRARVCIRVLEVRLPFDVATLLRKTFEAKDYHNPKASPQTAGESWFREGD